MLRSFVAGYPEANGDGTACPQRRNGNSHVAQGRPERMRVLVASMKWDGIRTTRPSRSRSVGNGRTLGGYLMFMGTSKSGALTIMVAIPGAGKCGSTQYSLL